VTSFLAEKFENRGRRVFVAMEGFKSLVSGTCRDFGHIVVNAGLKRLVRQLFALLVI
jgi:hypothetical protein